MSFSCDFIFRKFAKGNISERIISDSALFGDAAVRGPDDGVARKGGSRYKITFFVLRMET